MKTTISTTVAVVTLSLFALVSCKDNKNHQDAKINTPEEVRKAKKETADIADASFVDGMTGKVWHNYLQVRMALTASDSNGVQTAAGNMAEAFGPDRLEIKNLAQQLADTEDLDKQRKLFSDVGKLIGPLFTDALSEGTIYKKFCPMAFNNKGGYWYSDVSEIRNPYFADRMLRCGSIAETFKK